MIKRTLEISSEPLHLTVKNDQLLLLAKDDARTQRAAVPCEDIGLLLVEHAGTTYSHAALTALLRHGAALVVCGRNHLPAGLLLPVGEHTQVVPRVHQQIALKKPLRKQLWKQVVQAKIRAQAANLAPGSPTRLRLAVLAREVRSGDPANIEAQAAKVYWGGFRDLLDDPAFRRDRDGSVPNNLLNYGYAIVRAAVARALVAAGLLPALGIHHRHRANAFALADDLVEPLRGLVDARVLELVRDGQTDLARPAKTALLELLTLSLRTGEQVGPLMVALHRYVASLVRCYEGRSRRLEIPVQEAGPCT